MSEFDKIKYNNGYNKDNYKEIRFRIKKSLYDEATKLAIEKGYETLNAYAKDHFEKALERDNQAKTNVNNVTNFGLINNQTFNS